MGERASARETFENFSALARLVKLSDEDAAWLYPDLNLNSVRERLMELGVQLVAVTLGANGSTLTTPRHSLAIPAPSGIRGDTIGAGDSYTAALLAGILRIGTNGVNLLATLDENDLLFLGQEAAAAAAITVNRQGADLPYRAEISSSARIRGIPLEN
nr:PfkB family carbohydrate kinase [Subtercola boreus]